MVETGDSARTHTRLHSLTVDTCHSRKAYEQALSFCRTDEEREAVRKRRAVTVAEKKLDDERNKQAFGKLFEKEVYSDKPVPVLRPPLQPQEQPKSVTTGKAGVKGGKVKQNKQTEQPAEDQTEETEDLEEDGEGLLQGMWTTFKETCCCKKKKEL